MSCTFAAAGSSGCLSERSFPFRSGDAPDLNAARTAILSSSVGSTRDWLEWTDAEMRSVLPNPRRPTMTTGHMLDEQGRERDVYAYFDRHIEKMQGLFSNWWGIQHTAQSIEHANEPLTPPPWPGFERVWIPVAPGIRTTGFLGLARRDGHIIDADCIILLPGLWGDNGAQRSRDVSEALVRNGFHVLSYEPRGHGLSEACYPDIPYTFSVFETQDLLKVSEWLEDHYASIRRTGLMGFCWGANAALLGAWYDGRQPDDPSVSPTLRMILEKPNGRRHFEAGVIAFSPVLKWESFLDRMDRPQTMTTDLSASMFQKGTIEHMRRRAYPEVTGSLRLCISYDFMTSPFGPSFHLQEGYRFLRLLDYRGLPSDDKLEHARMPVLIVHGVNDPLMTAQETVDLVTQTRNPLVAGLVLPGGGHIGFQAWSRPYFYQLILRFFDPLSGPASFASAR